MDKAIFLNEFFENDLNLLHVGKIALELAEPLQIIVDDNKQRSVVPRNQYFYENTVLHYEGNLFAEHFRMKKETFEILLQSLAKVREVHHDFIPFEKKVLFTIWVLAKPEPFQAAGDRFGLARSSADKYFKEIVGFLVALMPQLIKWPENHQEAINVFQGRSEGFPGVIGAIDACHISIKQPPHNAHDYYNRKDFHSIILQGICDHRMAFIDIFVGMPGRIHDARVFRRSDIHHRITSVKNPLIPRDYHILGDSAYPTMVNVMTPFRDNGHLSNVQINYNIKFYSMHSVIDRTFGRLKDKFGRLNYLDIGNPELGSEIIVAACALHNLIVCNEYDDENYQNREVAGEVPVQDYSERNAEALEKRDAIAQMIY